MVGLGETDDEILAVMRDMRAHDIDMLTIGQYLQPTQRAPAGAALRASGHVRDVRARGVRDGLPARRGRRAGALVVSRRQAGGGSAGAEAPLATRSVAARPSATAATSGRPAACGRPRARPAAPKPQKKSARTAPRIAPPVSCASTSRCERRRRQRHRRREEDRRAQRNRARIDGDRALREQRHAERPDRPVDARVERSRRRRRHFAEEHVARILVEQRAQSCPGCAFAHALMPCIDARSRGRSPRSISTRADRAVRMAVLVGVAQAHHASRRRARCGPIPGSRRKNASTGSATYTSALPASGARAALDVRARPVRHDLACPRRGRARACP